MQSSFGDPTTAGQALTGNGQGLALVYKTKAHLVQATHPLHSDEDTGSVGVPRFFPASVRSQDGVQLLVLMLNTCSKSAQMTLLEHMTVPRVSMFQIKELWRVIQTSLDSSQESAKSYGVGLTNHLSLDDDIKKGLSKIQQLSISQLYLIPST
ncbi:hypothetical protein SCA6_019667 [Theobroma cacao]